MDSLNPEEEVSILKNGRSHASHEIYLHYYITFNDKVVEPRLTLSWPNFGSGGPFEVFKKKENGQNWISEISGLVSDTSDQVEGVKNKSSLWMIGRLQKQCSKIHIMVLKPKLENTDTNQTGL